MRPRDTARNLLGKCLLTPLSEASRVTGPGKWSSSFWFDRAFNENTQPGTLRYSSGPLSACWGKRLFPCRQRPRPLPDARTGLCPVLSPSFAVMALFVESFDERLPPAPRTAGEQKACPVLSTVSVIPLAVPFDSWPGLLFVDDIDLPGYLRRGSARETAWGGQGSWAGQALDTPWGALRSGSRSLTLLRKGPS